MRPGGKFTLAAVVVLVVVEGRTVGRVTTKLKFSINSKLSIPKSSWFSNIPTAFIKSVISFVEFIIACCWKGVGVVDDVLLAVLLVGFGTSITFAPLLIPIGF
jgi:hypothetical protein